MIHPMPDATTWENYPGGETLDQFCDRINADLIRYFNIDMRRYVQAVDPVEFWQCDLDVDNVAFILMGLADRE